MDNFNESDNVTKVFSYLEELFGPDPAPELEHSNDLELLVAIILSAQCTDKRVNLVTKGLFQKYKTLHDYADSDPVELSNEIYSTGFYKNKAANIRALAKTVIKDHGGVIPADMESLVALPGVGRKTANVFLSQWYKTPAIGVDTHVLRTSARLGFTENKTPDKVERDLAALFRPDNWGRYHLYLVLFGRYHCRSQNPKCVDCKLNDMCLYFNNVFRQSKDSNKGG